MAKKVMIVDDEPNICKTVKMILEGEGFEVLVATDGPDALNKLGREKVDLVLIDFFMPRMTGRDLAEAIREDPKLKNLKLVFLTVAQFLEEGKGELRRLKVSDYIQKPCDSKDLVRRVKKMVGEGG